MSKKTFLKRVSAGVLDVAYYESGPADGVPTRFLSPDTPRSGEQAALGADLLASASKRRKCRDFESVQELRQLLAQ